jgi:uncharacterized RDD family membrane protein YckC
MKCPKCRYLGFETGDRCRNCGYDFSLLVDAVPASGDLELPLHQPEAPRYTKVRGQVADGFDEAPFRQPDEPMVEIQLADLGSSSPPLPDTLIDWVDAVNGAAAPAIAGAGGATAARVTVRPAAAPPQLERVPLDLGFDAPDRMKARAHGAAAPPALPSAGSPPASRPAAPPATGAVPPWVWSPAAERSIDASPAPPPAAAIKPALPLFSRDDVDAPLVSVPSVLRPPLSVRRTPVPPARPRVTTAPAQSVSVPPSAPRPVLEFAFDTVPADPPAPEPPVPAPPVSRPAPVIQVHGRSADRPALATRHAGVVPRAVAGVIDHGILLVIDAVVLYFTLRMTGLAPDQWNLLPPAPLLAFLAFVKIAYFGVFTVAGGQTIGKMAMRLRVVTDDLETVSVARGLWRAAAGLVSVLPLGVGLLPILLGRDRRAFHDRVAGTRVVSMPSA